MPFYKKYSIGYFPRSIIDEYELPFFQAPRYHHYSNLRIRGMRFNSSSRMEVVMSTDIFRHNRGERQPYGLSQFINALNEDYQGSWVAGHLLNGELGGSGDYENLTPLTQRANRNHASFENHIRRIGENLVNFENKYPTHPSFFGIRYKVNVSDEKYQGGLLRDDYGVALYITLECQVLMFNKNNYHLENPIIDLDFNEPLILPLLNIPDSDVVQISRNEMYHFKAKIMNN